MKSTLDGAVASPPPAADSVGTTAIKTLGQGQHLGYLDSLRALAALYVVAYHALVQVDPMGNVLTGVAKKLSVLLSFGHQAVDVFIVLSGFCLMLPVLKNDGSIRGGASTFFGKRARRILPPYFCALALSGLLIATLLHEKTGGLWDVCIPVTPKGILLHLLMLHDLFIDTAAQINGALWTISVEWRIYFGFPLLVWMWGRFGSIPTTIAAVVGSYLLLGALQWTPFYADPRDNMGCMPQYIGLFAIGALGAGICFSRDAGLTRMRERLPWRAITFGLLVVALVLCKIKVPGGERLPLAFSDLAVGMWAAALLVAITTQAHTPFRRLLDTRLLVWIGTFSYSLYLIHYPLLQLFWQYGLHPMKLGPLAILGIQCLVGIPLIVLLAYLFFLGCERPFLNRRAPR